MRLDDHKTLTLPSPNPGLGLKGSTTHLLIGCILFIVSIISLFRTQGLQFNSVRGTAWYSLATGGLVLGGGVGGGVGRMVHCNSYSDN